MSKLNLKSNPLLLIILAIFFFTNFFIVDLALAVEVPKEMTLNIPVGSLINVKVGGNALGVYVQAWFQFLLGVIGIIATVMIMIGGFKYLTSQGDKGKIQDAQNMMVSAITGLILAFGSVAILGLVNPKLLTLKVITLEEIDYSGTYGKSSFDRAPYTPGEAPPVGNDNRSNLTEEEVRAKLQKNGITINHDNPCPEGQHYQSVQGGCTSVAGLQPDVIEQLATIKDNCFDEKGKRCEVELTGGTELGHHTGNRGYQADIGFNEGVNNYIIENGEQTESLFGGYPTYIMNGYYYVQETDHWHIQPVKEK